MRRAVSVSVAVLLSATVSVGVAQAAECHMNIVVYDPGDSGLRGQLRNAIVDVCDAGTILLRPGIVVGLEQGELVIPSGKTVTIRSPAQSESRGATIDAQGASRVIFIAEGANLTIERLTIQGGMTIECAVGGGIFNSGTLNLEDSTIARNTGPDDWPCGGGGIFNDFTAKVNLFGTSSISGNAGWGGAGIFNGGEVNLYDYAEVAGNFGWGIFNYSNQYGVVTLHDKSRVSGNLQSGVAGYYGNKVYLFDRSSVSGNGDGVSCCWSGSGGVEVELHDHSSISDNDGAAISAEFSAVTLNGNSAIAGNMGGGIRTYLYGLTTLNDGSSITSNTAGGDGGGIYNGGGTVTLNDGSSITSNTAGGDGGGIYNGCGTVTLNDGSSITSNTAGGDGGGIYNGGGTVTLNDVSFISGNIPDDCFLC
jgi:hypothetical protein